MAVSDRRGDLVESHLGFGQKGFGMSDPCSDNERGDRLPGTTFEDGIEMVRTEHEVTGKGVKRQDVLKVIPDVILDHLDQTGVSIVTGVLNGSSYLAEHTAKPHQAGTAGADVFQ